MIYAYTDFDYIRFAKYNIKICRFVHDLSSYKISYMPMLHQLLPSNWQLNTDVTQLTCHKCKKIKGKVASKTYGVRGYSSAILHLGTRQR
jgi:hypothetical protein